MKLNFKKALITGGLGFIGSHLVEKLLQNGVGVVIIDNKSTNVVDENFFSSKDCKVIVQSITDTDFSILKDIDIVFHLASILGPTGVLKHSGDIGIFTLNDTIKLRNYCIENDIPLIDISTSEVYGHAGILKENCKKIFPGEYQVRTEYGGAKMLAEMALINKAKFNSKLKFQIIRPFNVAGPRQKPDGGFVLPRFVVAALTNQALTVYGDGNQERAFTHVKDICDAIISIASANTFNEIWNIGNPENRMSIKEMAQQIIDLVRYRFPNKDPKMTFVDPTIIHGKYFAEVTDKIPYIKKIKNKIGWVPQISAEQVFNDTIDYYYQKVENNYYFKVS